MKQLKKTTQQIANLIQCDTNEIVFTSGATESINMAMKGIAEEYKEKGNHIITVQAEHKAVLDVSYFLESKGFEVTYFPVKSNGLVDLEELKGALTSNTLLVNVMLANNETGVIQPMQATEKIAHEVGAFIMTDAMQAFGKVPIDVDAMDIDLMPFSGHKIYGPKGIGELYVRGKRPRKVKLSSQIHGGGHAQWHVECSRYSWFRSSTSSRKNGRRCSTYSIIKRLLREEVAPDRGDKG